MPGDVVIHVEGHAGVLDALPVILAQAVRVYSDGFPDLPIGQEDDLLAATRGPAFTERERVAFQGFTIVAG